MVRCKTELICMQRKAKGMIRNVLSVLMAFSFSWLLGAAADAPDLKKLQAVPFTDVRIEDGFWLPRQEVNRTVSIPVNLENLEKAGNLNNFRLAARKSLSGFQGPVFMDSDVYKALEAASYSLSTHPDPGLEKRLDEIIALIAAAQQPDGYLNTYFTVKEPAKRWTNLRDQHELYCAGHMFEAAVAHYQATGKKNFLQVAVRLADCIDSVFGPPPKRKGYPGHPEIELALVKLHRATGEERYFRLARFFIQSRGEKFFAGEHSTPLEKYDGSYWQDDVPICEHENIKGHAVRACYLLSGATDVARETGDNALLQMIRRVWRNTVERNMYITGGIGPSAHNEGFTEDYDLPNDTAYQETCATIALAQWNHRLALLYGDARYADIVERALYNGMLAGVSQDGKKFFYVNPLESRGTHHRREWFSCACCPPNVARTLAALGGYAYAVDDASLWVHLYIQGSVKTRIGKTPLTLKVTTGYPWAEDVTLQPELERPAEFAFRLRLPGWSREASLFLNEKKMDNLPIENGYMVFSRTWQKTDVLRLHLPMPIRRMAAHPAVKADHHLTALQRGPLVYCLEEMDQTEPLSSIYLPNHAEFKAEKDAGLFGGMVTLKGRAEVLPEQNWAKTLYQASPAPRQTPILAIPYYAWDNRRPGRMKVWLPVAPPTPPVVGLETHAKVEVSFADSRSQPQGVNSGREPKNSEDRPAQLLHWWPHENREEWAQYTWKTPVLIRGVQVYWFDDSARGGGCRLPAAWRIQYLDGTEWKPVQAKSDYTVAANRWCQARFSPVSTSALRLVVRLPQDASAGVSQWKVLEEDRE